MIGDFVVEKMASYIIGGTDPVTAAIFTYEELEAIFSGNHRSRDSSGAFCVTPPPENLDLETAMEKAEAAITEILNYLEGEIAPENPAPMEPIETAIKTEQPSGAFKKSGLEGLKNYTNRKPA